MTPSSDPGDPVEPDELDPVVAAVLAANDAFYAAHEGRDDEAMAAVWVHRPDVVCIHPGWPALHGWEAVAESWHRIFRGPGRLQFILTNTVVRVIGDVAVVTVDENLVQDGGTATVAATNVFELVDGTWRLVAHHGSPVH